MLGKVHFSVIRRNMTPVPPKLKKVIFGNFGKKILFSVTFLAIFFSHVINICIDESHKKIQTLSVNFRCIFGISRIGCQKSEKNKAKREQFSWSFPK